VCKIKDERKKRKSQKSKIKKCAGSTNNPFVFLNFEF
jgi:hypothetical protein